MHKVDINLIDSSYSWMNMSLEEFIHEGNIPNGWEEFFSKEIVMKEIKVISDKLKSDSQSIPIFPNIENIFRAFIPPKDIKCVILGQDPYHNGSAVGICFSVKKGNDINPSLRNIYTELTREGFEIKQDGDLTHWKDQGCFMLNTALSVKQNCAGSYCSLWKRLSELIVEYLNSYNDIIWLLMGTHAQSYEQLICNNSHQVFFTTHPSPFSAFKSTSTAPAFIGSNVFTQINNILHDLSREKIKW